MLEHDVGISWPGLFFSVVDEGWVSGGLSLGSRSSPNSRAMRTGDLIWRRGASHRDAFWDGFDSGRAPARMTMAWVCFQACRAFSRYAPAWVPKEPRL